MVVGAEHVPMTDGSTDLPLQRLSKAALAQNLPLVLSSKIAGIALAHCAGSKIHRILSRKYCTEQDVGENDV